MDELPSHAKEWLARASEAEVVPSGARERVWQRVAVALLPPGTAQADAAADPQLSHAPVAASTLATSTAKWLSVTLLLAAGGGAFFFSLRHSSERPAPAQSVKQAVATPALTPRSDAAPIVTFAAPPEAMPAMASTPQRRRASPKPTAAGSGLADEMAILSQASQALAAGDTQRARALLDSHRQRFPHGNLLAERHGLGVLAGCMANETGCKTRAAAYLKASPDAVLSARIQSACQIEGTP
jgi:hypothetical protein